VRQPGPSNHTLYTRNPQANICTFSDQATKLSGIEMDAKASKTLAAERAHTHSGLLETMFRTQIEKADKVYQVSAIAAFGS